VPPKSASLAFILGSARPVRQSRTPGKS
jgi:hypothetical protein